MSISMLARQVLISDQNEGPIVNIPAWLGMTIMIFCVFTRIVSKWSVIRIWTVDDTVIMFTTLLAVAHTIMISMLVTAGLGQPQKILSDKSIEDFQKYAYSSQMLYIPVLCLAKLFTLIYLRGLSPVLLYWFLIQTIGLVIILWGITAELAIAFQCGLPKPWEVLSGQCFNRVALWNAFGVFDILTDLALIGIPIYLLWGTRMPMSKKVLVCIIFATRIFVTPVTILRMYYLNTLSSPSQVDQTLTSYHAYLATTIQLNLAVIVACLPFLRPFMESISTGGFSSTLVPMDSSYGPGSKENTFTSAYCSWRASNQKGRASKIGEPKLPFPTSKSQSQPRRSETAYSLDPIRNSIVDFRFGRAGIAHGIMEQGDLGNLRLDRVATFNDIRPATPMTGSSIGSDRMIIKKTTQWNVEEFYDDFRLEEVHRLGSIHAGTESVA